MASLERDAGSDSDQIRFRYVNTARKRSSRPRTNGKLPPLHAGLKKRSGSSNVVARNSRRGGHLRPAGRQPVASCRARSHNAVAPSSRFSSLTCNQWSQRKEWIGRPFQGCLSSPPPGMIPQPRRLAVSEAWPSASSWQVRAAPRMAQGPLPDTWKAVDHQAVRRSPGGPAPSSACAGVGTWSPESNCRNGGAVVDSGGTP